MTEGDAVFFNVNSLSKQYPVYAKDSILNTNKDFDYGPFELLEDMILRQNITVTTFSHIFKDQGIFVFENSVTNTLTVIAVVSAGQTCTGSVNGISAKMATKEALSQIGVKAYNKQISPHWWFIMLCFTSMNTLIYGLVGLFIWTYNLAQNQGRLSSKAQSTNTLYYDKLKEHDQERTSTSCFACCRKKENKVDKEEEVPEKKQHEFAVSYTDMEKLLKEFHECQAILKQQLKDREKHKRDADDDEKALEPIEQLIAELGDMAKFVQENNEVVNQVLEEELNEEAGLKKK